ncbi:MAG TPA: TauD/TfdA family dioxygenase [Stellaceae bacterium]|nr:TauD/TfdA family dioxygenase [Stellaceae bacterium]
MSFIAKPLTKYIASEISGLDLRQPLGADDVAALYRTWLERVILVFRGQRLEQEDLLRLAANFGTIGKLARPGAYRPPGQGRLLDDIMLISNIRENGEAIGALPDGEMMFHHDTLHAKVPDKGTFLYSVEVPKTGGNTLFANCYTAYETMPAALRDRLDGRRAFHHYNYGSVQRDDDKGVAAFSEATHPVFRTHEETGRKAVYVNRLMTRSVLDLPEEESDRLLAQVFDHSENPEWVYAHEWRVGDVILWDNRCSMHARTDFSPGERRLLLRVTVKGEVVPY